MNRRIRQPLELDVRAILESPVGRIAENGPRIGAYEASVRRAAEDASKGNMQSAKRFLGELTKYGLLTITEPADDHQYRILIPREWDGPAWHAMYNEYGPPPWHGEQDGLVPVERWEANYGREPRPVRKLD